MKGSFVIINFYTFSLYYLFPCSLGLKVLTWLSPKCNLFRSSKFKSFVFGTNINYQHDQHYLHYQHIWYTIYGSLYQTLSPQGSLARILLTLLAHLMSCSTLVQLATYSLEQKQNVWQRYKLRQLARSSNLSSPNNPNLKNVVEPPEPNSRTERFLLRREHMRETPPWSITLKYL